MRPKASSRPHPRAKRSLGQNFLQHRGVAQKVVHALALSTSDHVVEIGPGRGALTELLVDTDASITAVEKDDELAAKLASRFATRANLTVMNEDALTCDLGRHMPTDKTVKVVGNLPYNVASPIIRRLLYSTSLPCLLVFMVQREVADAMTAKPGDMTYLSVEVQLRAVTRRLMTVPPRMFKPRPRVTSALVSLVPRHEPYPRVASEERFLELVRAGFSARRKQLRNSLGAGLGISPSAAAQMLTGAGIDPERRPQTLSMEEWGELDRVHSEATV